MKQRFLLQRFSSNEEMRSLSPGDENIGITVFEKTFEIIDNEKILVVCSPEKLDEASIFFESAKKFTSNLSCFVLAGMTENAQEPPQEVLEEMCTSDVAVLVTSYSLSHTQARRAASEAGARIASLPQITLEMMRRLLTADPYNIRGYTEGLADRLTNGNIVHITSTQGTDLSLVIKGRTGIADTGILSHPGDFGNLPAGEAFIAPMEGIANGQLFVDGALADIELDMPVKLLISDGLVKTINGGQAADELTERMKEAGDHARVLCELGIGTNPKARLSPNALEAEKVFGTCHVAFGDNSTFGGQNFVPFHTDCVIAYPTVTIDNHRVV